MLYGIISRSEQKIMLCGYSLAGLFALWASGQSGTTPLRAFRRRSGFRATAIMNRHPIRAEHVYLSLGDLAKNKQKPRDGGCRKRNPRAVCAAANAKDGLRALEWNAGNHFREPERRCGKGRQMDAGFTVRAAVRSA